MKLEKTTKIPSDLKEMYDFVINSLEDMKAEDITSINVSDKTDITEIIIIASGRSRRNVNAIAEKLQHDLKHNMSYNVGIEGNGATDWSVIDLGDIIVHIMHPEAREHIQLEELWQKKA